MPSMSANVFESPCATSSRGLLLGPPQDRITAEAWRPSGYLAICCLRPGEILRREGEARGLKCGRCEAADAHGTILIG